MNKKNKNIAPALEVEVLNSVNDFLSIYGFDSIKKFRESVANIIFRTVLHPDPVDSEIEKALLDLQHFNRFLSKLEKYEAHIAK